jgi:hypothetical protein
MESEGEFMLSTVAEALLGHAPMLGYLDPGSGSMALQVMIAGMLSARYFVRAGMARVAGWFVARRPGR